VSTQHSLADLAQYLDEATTSVKAVPQISSFAPISLKDAYEIQRLTTELRIKRGENLIGFKMGFTSEAKMQQMGVHDMIFGRLTSNMLLNNGGSIKFNEYIHPRAEPEICFRIARDIDRELGMDEIKSYVLGFAVAIEIIDSRYENFKFSLEDVVADNCSSAAFVIGKWHTVKTPMENVPINLIINGNVAETGNTADILGDPWKALCAATRLAAEYNEPIMGGTYVMAGAASAAAFIHAGDAIESELKDLGNVSFSVQ
jgi:2-oxo-3-hexenedioate decarboxylase